MNQLFVRVATIACGVLVALFLGYLVGHGGFVFPLLLVAGLIFAGLCLHFKIRAEAVIAAGLLFGYLFGNRGFAQLAIIPGSPLFCGEVGLLGCVTFILLRIPLVKDFPFKLNAMGVFILLWILVSGLHMFFDLKTWGLVAIRDFATVYYALFFFVGQSIASHRRSLRLVLFGGFAGLVLIGPMFFVVKRFESFFFQTLVVNHSPVFFFKEDLVALSGAVGCVLFFALYNNRKNAVFLIPMVISYGTMVHLMSRAAFLSFAVLISFLILGKKPKILGFLAVVSVAGLMMVLSVYQYQDRRFQETRLYGLFEHMVSFVDVTGKFEYVGEDSGGTGDNNRYRLVWWQALAEQTVRTNVFWGLGFGYDLANPFLEEYYMTTPDDFRVRSPHNVLMTIFGRTGLIGLVVFLGIIGVLMSQTWTALERVRRKATIQASFLGLIVAWGIFIPACFQVVLEGPMMAVPFWLSLGISQALLQQEEARAKQVEMSKELLESSDVETFDEGSRPQLA